MPHSTTHDMTVPDDGTLPDAPSGEQGTAVKAESDDELPDDAPAPAPGQADVKLEDLFSDLPDDEDDEKDEYSGAAAAPEDAKPEIQRVYSDPEIMRSFYQRLFPFQYLFLWLNHSPSPTTDFGHREFAFTLQNGAYLRYQAFPTAHLLRKEILRLNPSRFEIGPVYTANPRDRKTMRKSDNFRPLAKELVFDIDLTDYDSIRTCCVKTNICHKCWSFVTMAIKVVDTALREDFGFQHILWVYSGRRGAHAWICDKRAREMDDQKRKAIAGYLEVIKGGEQSGKRVNVKRPLHPHLSRSLDILKDHFQDDILADQDPWLEDERADRLLQLLPDRSLNDALRKKWDSAPHRPSMNKWADIDALAKTGASRSLDAKALLEAKQDVVLEYTYPRLDVEVSKKLIHLLKSPFVVHPGTGRVCVPIDPRKLKGFDPLGVPTVTELLSEIDAWDREHGSSMDEGETKRTQDYEKTRLKPYVEVFKSFVASLMKDEAGVKKEPEEGGAGADAMEF
ncbi:MAG: hypothetical protein M1838_000980 [Thelocarpon superellum]|nr:MAG: hypothetical protein M1838_000980 [Thelocarpon superellum]